MAMKRRNFLKLAGALGAGAVYELYGPDLKKLFAQAASKHVIWLNGASDTGCTISLLQGVNPDLVDVITQFRLAVDFNPTLMITSGDEAVKALTQAAAGTVPLDVLIVEGAVPQGTFCTVGEVNGAPVTFETWVKRLAAKAKNVVAVGTCASYGGIPAAVPNPTKCRPVSAVISPKPVINVPGCPAHPDWITLTLANALQGIKPSLDSQRRPTAFFHETVHDECPLEEYSEERFASTFGEFGCLYRLGCRGPITRADCPNRLWNNKTSFCIKAPFGGNQVNAAGAPCIGCTQPGFPDPPYSPFYKRQTGSPED